jgi:hypothetical protein
MFSSADLLRLQQEQHRHDCRNHADIHSLHKTERLKHYGLHFCKYVGRLARGAEEQKSVERTLTDTFLVCLSAANTLHQNLSTVGDTAARRETNDLVYSLADAAGRFADACEKIDHLEDFTEMARRANLDVLSWTLHVADERKIDLEGALNRRRGELRDRAFYVASTE